ncbi:MAG: helix-turn-helix transcriptional regulator [Bacteroidales bacterium]|nr:helix-turn-helix transcriptional regulator [Bacteroidales bacterium]
MNKDEILNKLQNVVSTEPSKWHEDADFRFQNKEWLKRSQCVALNILRTLRAKDLSQKDLAERLGVSPQLVNKWVKGKENFTFETVAKLEEALNIELMSVTGFEGIQKTELKMVEIPYSVLTQNIQPEIKEHSLEMNVISFTCSEVHYDDYKKTI